MFPRRLKIMAIAALAGTALLGAGLVSAQQPRAISRVWPNPDLTEVDIGVAVTIDFNQAMDRVATAAAFTLEPAVPGRLVWGPKDDHLEFRPDEPLATKTGYTATLAETAKDSRGQPILSRPYRWSFSTGQAYDNMRFSYSVPVQLVTVAGGKGVPFQPGVPRLTVDLALYRVDLPGFAERYAKLKPYEKTPIPTDGLPQVAAWRLWLDASETAPTLALPKGTAPGLYLLDARHPVAGSAQSFVIYSDYALVAKAGLAGRTVWVSRLFTGEPAAGAKVSLLDASGRALPGAMDTDVRGVAEFAETTGAAFAAAEVDGQTSLVGLDQYWSNDGYWWGGWERGGMYQPQLPVFSGHAFTDRPIYRPGHLVHYKATVRRITGEGYTPVGSTVPVTVTIHDVQNNRLATLNPVPDAFGSIAGDFQLGDDVALGSWNVQVDVNGQNSFWAYFEVQAYVKPDFEVTVAPEADYYVQGDTARIDVAARYYFGQPAAGADATVRLYRGYYSPGNTPTLQLSGKLDAEGKWTASIPLTDNGNGYTEWWYMEAEVVDASRRPVVSQGSFPVHPATFELGLANDRYGIEVGQPVSFLASTKDHDGKPVAGSKIKVVVQQYYREGQRDIRTTTVTTGADGTVPVSFAGLAEGWYSVLATATDDRGHTVTANSYAWIYSETQNWYWWGGLEVAADKTSYAPGETARLLIKSPITTTALVTLERDKVYEEIIVPVSGATPVEVPISADYAPNVIARVHVWQPSTYEGNRAEGQLLVAETNLVVPAVDRHLRVTVTPDQASYEPGAEGRFTVRVTDAAGKPVSAQVALAMVDKSVLALAADRSGDIFDAFWSSRWQRATTYNSLQPSNWYGGKEDAGGGRGAQPPAAPSPAPAATNTADQASQAKPRREFPDTAYWNPALLTGADGTVTVTITMPDSLTTWQALARAVTVDTKVGQGAGEAVVTKAIMADPALPRFLVQGDQLALDVLARNYAGAGSLDAVCSLETPGLVQLDPGDKTLSLPFNETRFARWSVVASKVGQNPVTARVKTAAGEDTIELPLEVKPFTAPDRFVRAGGVTEATTEAFEVPFNAEPSSSTVELRLAPAMAVSVLDGLESLIDFPYGCVEQTMSRVLPNAVVGRLVLALDIQAPEITKRLPEMMALGLQKLYGFQGADGGWGWWYGEGNLYTTAYVLHGLTLTRQAGFDVDAGVIDRGFTWMAGHLDAEPDARLRAYALYVMAEAGRGDAERTAGLFGGTWSPPAATPTTEPKPRGTAVAPSGAAPAALPQALPDDLDSFSLAALAIALHRVGRDELSGQAMDKLVARVNESPTTASWPLPPVPDGKWWWEDAYYWRSMASTEKSTAMALEALAVLRPTSPLAPKAARWLLESRYGQGWSSTQATAYAVLALTDFINASGELRSTYDWAVKLDGSELAKGHVDGSNVTKRIPPITLAGAALPPGKHSLTLEKQGDGTLYYTALGRMALYYDGFAATAGAGIGMSLDRSYIPVESDKGSTAFHAGDVVNVRLTLTTKEDLWYLMIEDPLPAGLEGLNEQLDTETKRVPGQDPWYPWRWRWWGYERKEIRDDRVVFFTTRLPAGTHTFDYAARAVTPGTFSARPAEASTMYRPEIWARSASERVAIDPERVAPRPILAGDFDRDCRLTGFDAQLVAADWAAGKGRDLTGDKRVSVVDVALANGRSGAACGDAVGNPPGPAGALALSLRAVGEPRQREPFVVEVVADGHGNVGGFEVTIDLPAGAFEVVGAEAGAGLAGARLLGPTSAGGAVRLGGYIAKGVTIGGETVLARLTLRPLGTDPADLDVTSAQVVTDHGGEYTVTADGTVVSPAPWRAIGTMYLPFLVK